MSDDRDKAEQRQDELAARLLSVAGTAEKILTADGVLCAFLSATLNFGLRTNSAGELAEFLRQSADDLEAGKPPRSVQ